ncbi:MAG: hypothetical protein ACTSWQ_04425, partial [Candidatus Thorarchaeota archaeon]
IRSNYSKHIGTRTRISKQIEDVSLNYSIRILEEQVEFIHESTNESHTKKKCKTILQHIKRGIVTHREIETFIDEIMKKVQQEGNNWHRVLLSGYPQPRSLKEIIFAGDHFLRTPSGIQYLAEVPVTGARGSGKIDLVLFVRIQRQDRYIWAPIMILEVKTKSGFNFNLYGKRPRTKKPKVFVPVLNSWKEPLRKSEWEKTLVSVPPQTHTDQLDIYEKTLLSEYHTLIGETIGFKQLWKGVVSLDVSQEYETTKRVFDHLLDDLADRLLKGEIKGQWKTLTLKDASTDDTVPRVAITMTPAQGPVNILKGISSLKNILFENPFQERVGDDIFFTQYVSLSSPTSSGKTAAWFSKNWHLLNHLAELEKASQSDTSLVWIDLIGDFPSKYLIEKRFRLEELKKKKLIKNSEYKRLRDLLNRITFVSVREDIDTFLIEGESSGIESVDSTISSAFNAQVGNRIAVVDGWSDLDSMTSTTCRNNLQVLELSLLQMLRGQVNEVIWTDTGVDLPQVCEIYQRNCSSPLYYTSPRKQLIDEILWNVPTAPRKLGWQTPQYEDSRVIIQDLPTEQDPWTTVIHVPFLKGLGQKFSKASVRSPIIKSERYSGDLNQQQNMYGRNFRSSSIQVRSDVIDRVSIDVVTKHATRLIPSLLRPRRGQPPTPVDKRTIDWTTTYQYVDVGGVQSSLSSRLHLDVTRKPPHPNRIGRDHEGIYVDAEGITRGWIHKTPIEDDEDEPAVIFRRSPHAYSRERPDIDTLETRRREIQRITTAAKYLARTKPHYDALFQEIASICDYDRDDAGDEDYLLKILQQVKAAILRKNEPRQLWKLLLNTRLHSADLLNTDNQRFLRQAQQYNPELLELYGMNLFLGIASVTDRVLKKVEPSVCKSLWATIAGWQFYQMGFDLEEDKTHEQRYDFQTIHANLLWRAKQMKKIIPAGEPRFREQFGQLLWREGSDEGHIWLLFPSFKNTMFGVFIQNQMNAYLHKGWYRGEIDPEQNKIEAEDALSREGWDEFSIVLVDVNTQRVLFVKSEGDEGEEWNLVGAFEYGNPPKNQSLPVRWIRLFQPLPETLLALHGFMPGTPPADIQARCNKVLREASDWTGIVREVTCFLTIDLEKKVYKIDLLEASTAIAQKETTSTDEVISFLRYPLRKGEYFSTSDGTYLKWDPMSDIEYDDVTIKDKDGKLELFSLSMFKPLIHRSSFYPDRYSLPSTCEELLQTKEGEDIIVRIIVDERMKNMGSKKYLKVHFDGLKKSGRLVGLESEGMGIFDVALLVECDQLADMESGTRYYITINAESLVPLRLVHILSEYPKLQSAIVGHIEDLELTEIDENEEDFEEGGEWDEEREIEQPEVEYIDEEFEED